MFRSKKKEGREKKRHKPGMTQDEITKLEEVGIRRGFFSKKSSSKREKDEPLQKRDISRPLSLHLKDGDRPTDKEIPSVLQRANIFGQVVQPQRRTSSSSSSSLSMPAAGDAPYNATKQNVESSIKHPVAPVRRKTSTKSSKQQPHYDVPRAPVAAANEGYSTPHSWKDPIREAHLISSQKLPPTTSIIRTAKPRPQRTVVLRKRTAGDFGVSLRRSAMIEHINNQEVKKTVFFAEPGSAMLAEMDFKDDISSRLYSGDRLIAIDGVNVENASRDDIVARIRTAGNQVTLVVQSMQDTDEVSLGDGQDSGYSLPRKTPDQLPQLRKGNGFLLSAKDDGAPKLPAAKKREVDEKVTANSEKQPLSRQGSGVERTVRLGSTSDMSSHSHGASSSNNNLETTDYEQVQVTPNELHASSALVDACMESITSSDTNDGKFNEKVSAETSLIGEDGARVEVDVAAAEKCSDNEVTGKCETVCTDNGINDKHTSVENEEAEAKVVGTARDVDNDSAKSNLPNVDELLPADPKREVTEFYNNNREAADNSAPLSSADVTKICGEPENSDPSVIFPETEEVEPKQNGLPEVIHIPNKPGITWQEKENVWYKTPEGLASAHVVVSDNNPAIDQVPEGKQLIKVKETAEVMMVPDEDVELANEAQFDRAGDVTTLRHLNESSTLHTLSQRYEGSLLHTFAGPHLVSVRLPYLHGANSSNYVAKVKQTYKGTRFGDTPPHLYAIAQHAYQDMMSSLGDQCIVSIGVTGSGKTSNTRHTLSYFATIGAHTNSRLSAEKVVSVVNLFESVSSSATKQCKNASRCVHVYNLDFDRTGQLAAVSVQAMLLERSRLVKRPEGEANFNIFYQLLHGADTQLRRELFLLDLEQESNPLIVSSFNSDPAFHQMAVKGFASLQTSFDSLGFTPDEVKAIYYVLAATLHLGMAGSQKVSGGRYQFARADSAQKAASLLGVPAEKLSKDIFQSSSGKRSRTSSSASLKRSNSSLSSSGFSNQAEEMLESGQQSLDTFIIRLYSQVFRTIVSLINRSLSSSQRAQNTILVVDAPGYQGWDPKLAGHPASYSDLTFNYVQDRLHALFHHNAFTTHKERYQQEGIECDVVAPDDNFSSCIDLVDQPPSLGNVGAKGLLWLLDEEASSPGATDESFIERFLLHYNQIQNKVHSAVQRSSNQGRFILHHQAGACSVEYDATGWLRHARYNSAQSDASDVLQDSKKNYISVLFGSGNEKVHGSVAGLKLDGGSSNLKRASSFRKGWSSGAGVSSIKKPMCMLMKFQTDNLLDTLRRAQPHFILSFLPQTTVNDHQNLSLDLLLMRKQLRGFQLLDASRTHKQGYPEHVVFSEFRRRFDVLLRQLTSSLPRNSTTVALMEDQEATENILKHVELSRSQYRIGASQVFFRSGVLNMLEDRRNEKLSNVMIAFQAHCRGYLARKRHERKKVQVVAVRCIQRNIRKFMAIRQWPWWRLLTKVLPLVEVTRTEEELREKQADLDLLKEKFERIQSERDDLKLSNSKYEMKLQDVMMHLEEERAASAHANEMLEHESKERIRFEKLANDTQVSYSALQDRAEAMEVELAEKRLLYAEHVVDMMDSDDEIEDGHYKAKYEQAVREFNFQTKKRSQEHEDALEEAMADKKTLERKLQQIIEELDDQRRLEQLTRKKLQRVNAELSDAKIHLDETTTKNHDLEKKQRKFDSELYSVQADVTDLKTSRDRIQREKDKIMLEKKELEREVDEKVDEIDSLSSKVRRLEEELEDSSTKDTDDRQMVNQLKKQIRELDAKVKDQEEELDEQANTIHTLEQARERLEMSSEQARQQRQREVDGKEEELEEMRTSYHKKIKQLEIQLEEVEEERASILKQKRELEQEVKDARENGPQGHDVEMEKRLRKDLKRYKALLADAQTMIDHLKADVVSKQQMRQLKAQVEDLQYTSASAVKSRKAIELEMEDLQAQLEEISRGKQESEARVSSLQRETHELNSKLEEDAEDAQETLRKYRSLVNQQTDERRHLVEAQATVEELKHEKALLDDKIIGLQSQVEFFEENTTDKATAARLESKAKDLETKLDFQKTATRRLEVQLTRTKENLDKCMSERDAHIAGEHREKEAMKRMQRQLREAKEEQGELLKREQEALQKKHDLEMEVSEHQNQIESLQSDLKLAFKRISDLQLALEELEESDIEDDEDSVSSSDDEDLRTSSKYGWRSRLSTASNYSDRVRRRSSIASSSSSSADYDGSQYNAGKTDGAFDNVEEYS